MVSVCGQRRLFVPGIEIGHATNTEALTGCTVILAKGGAVGGVDVRGGSAGTRGTDALRPLHRVQEVHGIVLSGGSSFGLDAIGGVMAFLEEKGIGLQTSAGKIPIVAGAILYDLGVGSASVRPDRKMGYEACLNASNEIFEEGNVGAGTGATVGKMLGSQYCTKSGLGVWCEELGSGLVVGAVVAMNAVGDVVNDDGSVLAGPRDPETKKMLNTLETMKKMYTGGSPAQVVDRDGNHGTVLAVVATNALLTKEETSKVAQMGQDGLARCVSPAHTMFDGDVIFALSTNQVIGDVNLIGAMAAEAIKNASRRAVLNAAPAGGIPSCTWE